MQQVLNYLTSVHQYLKQKSDKSDQMTQTEKNLPGLLRLPGRLLGKIFIYLDINSDIFVLSISCKFMNKFLSGYYMQSLLYKQVLQKTKPKDETVLSEQESKQSDLFVNTSKEDLVQRFSKSCRFHVLISNAIQKSDEKSKELIQSINKLNDELRIQKQINSKTLTKKNTRFYESKEIEKDNLKAQNQIIETKAEHLDIVQKITDQIRKIEAEKTKARSHARILHYALEDAQADHKSYTTKLRLLKENLFKLKSYCNEMLEPKISKILTLSTL